MSVGADPGGTAMFTVMLNSPDGVTFQWLKDTAALTNTGQYSGVDTDTLTISNVDGSFDGEYSVELSRSTPESCTVESPTATLTVCECLWSGDRFTEYSCSMDYHIACTLHMFHC